MDLSFVLGLAAAVCWGSGDFVAKLVTDRLGYLRTGTFMQYVGGLLLLALTFQDLTPLWRFPSATYLVLGLGVVNASATVALYKSFEVGQLSIVSPIASSYPALSTILAVMLLNETVSQTHLVGIVSILMGIIMVSLQNKSKVSSNGRTFATGVGYAILSFVLMGLLYFALKIAVASLGGFLPVLVIRWESALILTAALVLTSARANTHARRSFLAVVVVGVVDSVANIAYNLGISIGTVAIVSTLSGLFSAVTVLLACVFLKERLAKHQGLGFLAILVGVSVIGYL